MSQAILIKKLLSLPEDMVKLLRLIGFLVFAFVFWQIAGDTFTETKVDAGKHVTEKGITVGHQEDACVSVPQLPYLPDAELTGLFGHSQSLSFSRLQRSLTTEYFVSLKSWVNKLAQREAMLSLHREKLYDATSLHNRCQPACEYYIFTLRRIII